MDEDDVGKIDFLTHSSTFKKVIMPHVKVLEDTIFIFEITMHLFGRILHSGQASRADGSSNTSNCNAASNRSS